MTKLTFRQKDTDYIIIKKYISYELQDELFAHTEKIKHRKLIVPSIEEKKIMKINDRKKDKMYLVRKMDEKIPQVLKAGALSSSKLSPLAQHFQQLLHEEEMDESQSVSMPPRQHNQKQQQCLSAAPIESMKYAESDCPGPSIVPESSFKPAWNQSDDYLSSIPAVHDLFGGEMKSSVKRESNHHDIADIFKGNDEVDELLAQWTTLAPSEFSQHNV